MRIKTVEDFDTALENGPYAWPGGYPLYFLMRDGDTVSFGAAVANQRSIRQALKDKNDPEWEPVALDVNWEDVDMTCAHTGEPIESAYGDRPE